MNLKGLKEKRAALVEQMGAIVNAAVAEERGFTEEENTKHTELKGEIDRLDMTIAAAEEAVEEQRALEKPAGNCADKKPDDGLTAEERGFVNYIRGTMETRADVNMTKTANGAAIPTTVARKIIEIVKDRSPILALATPYNVKGNLVIPVEDPTGGITAGYADEFVITDGTAEKLTSITLSGFLIKGLSKVSKSLLNNSDLDLFNYVIRKMADAMIDKLELEYLIGTNNKIEGIKGGMTQDMTVTAASATALTADELIDTQDKVIDAYQGKCIWIMNSKTRTAIRKLKDGQGNYLLERDFTAKWGWRLLGRDVYTTDNMPAMAAGAYAIYYGDMSGLASKIVEDIDITVLLEKYAEEHAIGVVAFAEVDAKIENKQKIAALKMKAS